MRPLVSVSLAAARADTAVATQRLEDPLQAIRTRIHKAAILEVIAAKSFLDFFELVISHIMCGNIRWPAG